jgi:arylsulfatase A-like enzyme
MKKKPNIILITVDSLRADHLGYMGYGKGISPNIDKLAGESVVFNNAFAVGPVTPHSFPSILTSTYPLDYQGPRKIERPRKLISEVLKEKGFITAAFHSNAYLSNFFGYNRGSVTTGGGIFLKILFQNTTFLSPKGK